MPNAQCLSRQVPFFPNHLTICIMSLIRDLAYVTAAAVSSPVWGVNLLRTGKWRTDWPGRFGRCEPMGGDADRPRLLIHAVSLGEVNATRQLIALLEAQHPEVSLIIATTTDTGYQRAVELYAARHSVVRYPLDFSPCVNRFLDAVRPVAVALVELEVWPNFVEACTRRSIPVCVINGRLSERSFGRYQWISPLIRRTFARLTAAAVQTPEYATRFKALGVPADRVHVLDNMKWDTAVVADDVQGADELAAALGVDRTRPVVVAGSTGPGEEQLLINAMDQWPEGTQLILVPRKPERFDDVAQLLPGMVRRTRGTSTAEAQGDMSNAAGSRVMLVDTMGELRKAYALSDVAVVGRSFNGMGGSDPIEPIGLGKPTVIGPDVANFADVVVAFQMGGGITVSREVGRTVATLLADRNQASALAAAGRAVIAGRRGATQRHVDLLLRCMRPIPTV